MRLLKLAAVWLLLALPLFAANPIDSLLPGAMVRGSPIPIFMT